MENSKLQRLILPASENQQVTMMSS